MKAGDKQLNEDRWSPRQQIPQRRTGLRVLQWKQEGRTNFLECVKIDHSQSNGSNGCDSQKAVFSLLGLFSCSIFSISFYFFIHLSIKERVRWRIYILTKFAQRIEVHKTTNRPTVFFFL
jgi:hypothetical protein